MPSTNEMPSRQVLGELPSRALKFLSTVSCSKPIHAALAQRGYVEAEHERGWTLLLQVSGYRRPQLATLEDREVRDAVVELDQWDEPNFRIVRAALEQRHPEQGAFVLDGLEPQTGAASVVAVAMLLDRLDALEKSPERKETRKADLAALDTLRARGIDKAERDRLRMLVDVAKSPANGDGERGPADAGAADTSLRALRAWYVEWSEVARAIIKRRSDLIRLGLARRKPMVKRAEPEAASGPKPS